MAKRVALFLLALAIGYFLGFADGRRNERNLVVRAVDRVSGVAENTVGAREKRVQKELEELTP